jgi:hypothetical protein
MKKISLTKDQIDTLSDLPETGMGYQIVDITLNDGTVLKNKVVLNSSLLQLKDDENINPEDISNIEVY